MIQIRVQAKLFNILTDIKKEEFFNLGFAIFIFQFNSHFHNCYQVKALRHLVHGLHS